MMGMVCYSSKDEYYGDLKDRAALPSGFRVSSVPLSFFPEERPSQHPYDMNLSLIHIDPPGGTAAGVFTRNSFPGAPVIITAKRIRSPVVSGVLVNNRIANVCAPEGVRDAEAVLAELERLLPGAPFLTASTGIIGWRLPVTEMKASLPGLVDGLSPATALPLAEGIMTTDSFPKIRSARVGEGRIVGIAKGAGMIEPNMATMLVFICTDISIPPEDLDLLCRVTASKTFNTITIDGDQSTSDMMLLLSSGKKDHVSRDAFARALYEVCRDLAEDIVRNGEGTGHVIRVRVTGAPDEVTAGGTAKSVANSPLVKTAVYGNDPNVGRIIMAIGKYAGNKSLPLYPDRVTVEIGGHCVFREGSFRLDGTMEEKLSFYLREGALPEICPGYPVHDRLVEIGIDLGMGSAAGEALGSDLSYQYVKENADYRT